MDAITIPFDVLTKKMDVEEHRQWKASHGVAQVRNVSISHWGGLN